jgi:hypothetical protein
MDSSDNSSDNSDFVESVSPIEMFIDYELDNIIDLFYDIKNRFYYFLGDRSEHLTEFVIDNIYQNSWNKTHVFIPQSFVEEYQQEIIVTLNSVNNFLASRKWVRKYKPLTKTIKESNWIEFCYLHTT